MSWQARGCRVEGAGDPRAALQGHRPRAPLCPAVPHRAPLCPAVPLGCAERHARRPWPWPWSGSARRCLPAGGPRPASPTWKAAGSLVEMAALRNWRAWILLPASAGPASGYREERGAARAGGGEEGGEGEMARGPLQTTRKSAADGRALCFCLLGFFLTASAALIPGSRSPARAATSAGAAPDSSSSTRSAPDCRGRAPGVHGPGLRRSGAQRKSARKATPRAPGGRAATPRAGVYY